MGRTGALAWRGVSWGVHFICPRIAPRLDDAGNCSLRAQIWVLFRDTRQEVRDSPRHSSLPHHPRLLCCRVQLLSLTRKPLSPLLVTSAASTHPPPDFCGLLFTGAPAAVLPWTRLSSPGVRVILKCKSDHIPH